MSRKHAQAQAQTPEEIRIAQGLNAARMAEQIRMQGQAQQQAEVKQRDMMIRMFVSEAAKDLYIASIANNQDDFKSDDDFIKLADGAHRAALVLAERLGMINPVTDQGIADLEESKKKAEEESGETAGGILLGE